MDETRVREIVREEITLALGALAASARNQYMPYETGEIEGTALRAFSESADGAVREYAARCETADEQRAQDAENPFEDASLEGERRRVTHAAAYLPTADLNALPAGAYKLLGNLARNDAYTDAVIRLMQHGGPNTGT